jgi:hypothetical protein
VDPLEAVARGAAIVSLTGAVLLVQSDDAHATNMNGYVCSMEYVPYGLSTNYGSSGYGFVSMTSGPACTGTWYGAGIMCSEGASSSICGTTYRYTEAQLMALVQSLSRASAGDQSIGIFKESSGSVGSITFLAD